jgi:hypothetical protein
MVWWGRHKVSPRLSTGELLNTFAAIAGRRAGGNGVGRRPGSEEYDVRVGL